MSADAADDGKCHFYLPPKKRYCRFQPKEGQQYCPEHSCIMGIHSDRLRVPCPLNPTHNCYADDLEKHVKKCNVTKLKKSIQEASYYIQGVNKGPVRTLPTELPGKNKKVCVKDLTSTDLAAMIARVNKLFEDHVEKVESLVLEHTCVRDEYCQVEEDLSKALGSRHLFGKSYFNRHLLLVNLMSWDFSMVTIALLKWGQEKVNYLTGYRKQAKIVSITHSYWLTEAVLDIRGESTTLTRLQDYQVKCGVARQEHYTDGRISQAGGAEPDFKRIKIDIEDLCLGHVDLVDTSNSVVVVGKHLCGGATDMGIRCAVETLGIQKTSQDFSSTWSSSNDQSVPVLDNAKHQNTHTHKSEISLSERVTVPQLEKSENETSKSPTATDNVPDVNTLPSTDANILVDGLSSPQCLSDTQSCKQSPGYLLDARKQHENLAEEAAITSDKPIETVTLCNIGYIQQNKSTVNEDRTTSINNNIQTDTKDSKRKDCDTVSLTDGQAPPAKSMRLADREYRHRLPKGIMIALCCHHSCTWDTYLGQEFMHSCGVSPQEFDLLTRLSSWATCAKVTVKSAKNQRVHEKSDYKKSAELNEEKIVLDDQDEIEIVKVGSKTSHETNDLINLEASKTLREQLSVSEREEIGFKCKRLIDTGRLHYLRSKGMKCLLRRYISEELTPENVVLIAYLPSS